MSGTDKNPLVLVVEDEPFVQQAVKRVLEGENFAVAVASSAAEGRAKITELLPDVVVSDWGLAHSNASDGKTVIHAASKTQPPVPIRIAMSGRLIGDPKVDDELRDEMELAGATHTVAKPQGLSILAQLIRDALAQLKKAPGQAGQ